MPLGKVKKFILEQLRDNAHILKEIFVDTIQFAIDNELVKYLYTKVIARNIHKKIEKIRMDLNDLIITENLEIFYKKN